MGLEDCVPLVPLHVSPFPDTVHETALSTLQEIVARFPAETKRGDAVMLPEMALYRQVAEPGEQNWGATHVVTVEVSHEASVYVMMSSSSPVQVYAAVHETPSAAPTPPAPVPVHCAVPPAPVQEAVYVVADDGDTDVLPEVAPPVEKLVPVQEVALEELQVSVEEFPCVTEVGDTETAQIGAGLSTLQEAYVYEPDSEPFEHERLSETQDEPYGTVLAWYAVTDEP